VIVPPVCHFGTWPAAGASEASAATTKTEAVPSKNSSVPREAAHASLSPATSAKASVVGLAPLGTSSDDAPPKSIAPVMAARAVLSEIYSSAVAPALTWRIWSVVPIAKRAAVSDPVACTMSPATFQIVSVATSPDPPPVTPQTCRAPAESTRTMRLNSGPAGPSVPHAPTLTALRAPVSSAYPIREASGPSGPCITVNAPASVKAEATRDVRMVRFIESPI
jgi:hypothetical protein